MKVNFFMWIPPRLFSLIRGALYELLDLFSEKSKLCISLIPKWTWLVRFTYDEHSWKLVQLVLVYFSTC